MKTAQEIREAVFDALVKALVWLCVCAAALVGFSKLMISAGLSPWWALIPSVLVWIYAHHFFKRVLK